MAQKHDNILIVDDHAASALSLAHFCRVVADRVDIAHSAQEALDKLTGAFYGCIVVDCRLPDRDGLELTRWIRSAAGPNCGTLIIGVSADLRYSVEHCREAGMNELVHKPYAPRALVQLIASLV